MDENLRPEESQSNASLPQIPSIDARVKELETALKPFAVLATQYDELRKSGECHSWIEFLADFYWPNEGQCVAARSTLSQGSPEQ